MTFRALRPLALCLLLATVSMSAAQRPPATGPIEGRVYLTPTCGCCGKWVEHMNAAGFKLTREMTTDMDTVAAHHKVHLSAPVLQPGAVVTADGPHANDRVAQGPP